MAPRGRLWCLLCIAVAGIVGGASAVVVMASDGATTGAVVPAATPPCPFITASSPQTLSTTPPPVPLNPCPGVVAGTFLGGRGTDDARGVAVDASGYAYVVGLTNSTDFPTTPDAYDGIHNGGFDAFVSKFDPRGALVYSTFLGGSGEDKAESIAMDRSGNLYVAGSTASTDFPTSPGAYDGKLGDRDAFVAKFGPTGSFVYSTLLGGSGPDGAASIAVDASGQVHVTGYTSSADFPITPGTYTSEGTAFVVKLNPEGTDLVFSTVIGATLGASGRAIALDAEGSILVAGGAFVFKLTPDGGRLVYSTSLEGEGLRVASAVTADSEGNAHVAGLGGAYWDAVVLGLSPTGDRLLYSFVLGSGSFSRGGADAQAIYLDESETVHVAGNTGGDFPTTSGAYDDTRNGGSDAFVAKLEREGRGLNYSTYLGGGDDVLYPDYRLPEHMRIGGWGCSLGNGSCDDIARSLAVDPTGNTTVVGGTTNPDFPTTQNAFDPTYNGGGDAFLIRIELIPEPNRAPVAYFEVTVSPDDDDRVSVNASGSADAEDADGLLEVRWDWEDDGIWDTEWSTVKTGSHEYAAPGTYTIRLEVQDVGGLSGDTTRQVVLGGGIQWIRQYGREGVVSAGMGGTSGQGGDSLGIAVDASGVYMVGSALGPLMGQASAGAFVRKYDLDGNEVWTRQFGTSSSDEAHGVAVDGASVYVAGFTSGVLPGQTNSGGIDAFVRKYDLDGSEIWTRQFGTSSRDYAWGIAVDVSGVYVAGFTIGALPGQMSEGAWDAFVRKYDVDGNEIWTRQFGDYDSDGAFEVAVDNSGVYVAGFTYTYAGSRDAFVRKYDLDGNEMWTRQFGTLGQDQVLGIAVDTSGAYVAGSASGALPGQTSTGGEDAFVRKYDVSGNEVWTRQFGTSGSDFVSGIAVGTSDVYVAGSTEGVLPGQTNSGWVDAFIRKYDLDGSELWTRQIGTSSFDYAWGIAVDVSDVYVAGAASGALPGQTNAGAFVRKYGVSGNEIWTRQFGSMWWDSASGIAVDASGVYVVGWTAYALETYTAEAVLRKYDVDGNELWTRQFGFLCPRDRWGNPPPAGWGSLRPGDPLGIAVDASGAYVAGTLRCQWEFGTETFVRKYDAQGNEVWTRLFNSSSDDRASGIAVGASGVYLAGLTKCLFCVPEEWRAFLRKYDVNGNEVWTRQLERSEPDRVYRIAVDTSGVYRASSGSVTKYDVDGNWVWTRQFGGSARDVAVGAPEVYVAGSTSGAGDSDALVLKYDVNGNELWTRQFGTSGEDLVLGLAIDPSGVYMAGSTTGAFPGQTGAGTWDAFVRKYDVDGNEVWTRQFGTSESDHSYGIAVDVSGAYVAGSTLGVFPGQTSAGGQDAFVARLNEVSAVPDNVPPVLSVPDPIVAEAIGPSGAKADYTVTAEDDVDGSLAPVCAPASGSVFPLGTTTVTCTARDSSGNEATATFTVEVRDSRPPVLTVPADIQVEAIGLSGATVTFEVTAADLVDSSPVVSCSPSSGSTFGIGTTTVTCTAMDSVGNTATASFEVTVTERVGPSGFVLSPLQASAVVVAIGALVITVVAIVRRRRKGRGPSGGEGGTL
jgi:hypothetical protein